MCLYVCMCVYVYIHIHIYIYIYIYILFLPWPKAIPAWCFNKLSIYLKPSVYMYLELSNNIMAFITTRRITLLSILICFIGFMHTV